MNEERDTNILIDVNGHNFSMQTTPETYISVLAAGYIITPEGKCVTVNDNTDHNAVFSEYLYNYLGKQQHHYYESTEGAQELCKIGHVVYFGMKPKDFKDGIKSDNLGFGIVLLPSPITDLTEGQKEALKQLVETNISVFRKEKIINLQFGDIVTGKEYNEQDIMELINNVEKSASLN